MTIPGLSALNQPIGIIFEQRRLKQQSEVCLNHRWDPGKNLKSRFDRLSNCIGGILAQIDRAQQPTGIATRTTIVEVRSVPQERKNAEMFIRQWRPLVSVKNEEVKPSKFNRLKNKHSHDAERGKWINCRKKQEELN
jgi:hypothetical protein